VIRCRVLGPVALDVNGAPPPPELLWRKHLALLLYLARSPKRTRTREHLTGLLWGDKDESAARHSLNEALRVLRRTAGDAAIEGSGGQIHLAEAAVRLDSEDLEHWVAERDWAKAVGIIAGEFLEGFAVPGSTDFEDWLAAERSYWCGRSVSALLGHAEARLADGNAEAALLTARRAEAFAPRSDAAVQLVLQALAVRGERAEAQAHYDDFAARLEREFCSTPSETTRLLAERISKAKGPRAPAQPAAGAERRRAPLVGRARELAALLAHWERCEAGPLATALVIEGEAGSGKSRLLEELATRVRLRGATVALVRAVEADLAQPGSGVLGLARGGLLDAPGLPAAAPGVLAAFAAELPEWADRFAGVLGVEPGAAIPQALPRVLEAALDAGALLLVVDDAQWLDSVSLLALFAALRDLRQRPLALILACLPEPQREELDQLRHRLGHDVAGVCLQLGVLEEAALRELAAWTLPHYDSIQLERITRRVACDSAGFPLLAVELLSAVAQGLDVREGSTAWPNPLQTLTQSLPGDLPDTVISALRVSFRRLSPPARETLVAAAILGDGATESLLERATGLERRELQPALDELEWQNWLEADGRGYGFVARLARQVIAQDMLTPGQRRRICGRIGLPVEGPA